MMRFRRSIFLAALLLAGCAVERPEPIQPVSERELLCRGPVAVIPDDDPGLALYADVIASEGLEEAKIHLALDRGETCDDDEMQPEKEG
jgi:hypothetical protein